MEAYLYEKREDHNVRCILCRHRCMIQPDRRGICAVRENRGGVLHTLVFGKLIARHVDPIEKKPLYHFFPGSLSYSVATVGCNFKCLFCQNADIAQMPADQDGEILGRDCTPKEIVEDALRNHCRSISYTYTEPTVFFEFAYETAKRAHAAGIKNVFVTNGYMSPEALEMIKPFLDAANVDLKAYNPKYYSEVCGAKLEGVKKTLKQMVSAGVFVEVTTLIVPGLNDDLRELHDLAAFLVDHLGDATPWHISRFHPTHRLTDRPPTPLSTLVRAREIGLKAGLKYVYTGNVPGEQGENTFCPGCKNVLIERWGFQVRKNRITGGRCPGCRLAIHGVGM